MIKHLVFLIILATSPALMALEYGGAIENTQWQVSGSVFECRFEQTVPGYGTGVFYHRAGEDIQFRLEAVRNLMAYSNAQVGIMPAAWQPSRKSEPLGTAKIVKESPNLSLDSKRSNQFLHALLEGKQPAVSHYTYYDQQRFVGVRLSAASFQDYYPQYLQCVNQLLRVNFDQVKQQRVLFQSNGHNLTPTATKQLEDIAYYIKNDPRVTAVYLDGHTDSIGRRFANREISHARAQKVEQFLINNGVNPDIISTRFHGDRYPIATNKTAAGRAANRRVAIELEQNMDILIPDELIFRPHEIISAKTAAN